MAVEKVFYGGVELVIVARLNCTVCVRAGKPNTEVREAQSCERAEKLGVDSQLVWQY